MFLQNAGNDIKVQSVISWKTLILMPFSVQTWNLKTFCYITSAVQYTWCMEGSLDCFNLYDLYSDVS